MRIVYFLLLLTVGFSAQATSNQTDYLQILKDKWHYIYTFGLLPQASNQTASTVSANNETVSEETKPVPTQADIVKGMREGWHQFLPTALRLYPEYDSVQSYQLTPQIYVYEPSHVERILVWIPGNAFMFDEPESHHSFLRYVAETTKSRIFALSHRKIPEFTYDDIRSDLLASFDFLSETKQFDQGLPVVLVGDSSGALLATHLLSNLQEKTTVDQLLLIAPGLDMRVFTEKDGIIVESYPQEAQAEVANQNLMMTFIASLLYSNGQNVDSAIEALSKVNNRPRIHVIAFEYDIFYPQALQLQSAFDNVTIDCREKGWHVDYLLKRADEGSDSTPFVLTWN